MQINEKKAPKGIIARSLRGRVISWDPIARSRAVFPPSSLQVIWSQQMNAPCCLSHKLLCKYSQTGSPGSWFSGPLEGCRAGSRASPHAKPCQAAHAETRGRRQLGEAAESKQRCTICVLCGHLSWKDSHFKTNWSLPRDLLSFTAGCS